MQRAYTRAPSSPMLSKIFRANLLAAQQSINLHVQRGLVEAKKKRRSVVNEAKSLISVVRRNLAPNSSVPVGSKLPATSKQQKRLKRLIDCKPLLPKRLRRLPISCVKRLKRKKGRLLLLLAQKGSKKRRLKRLQRSDVHKSFQEPHSRLEGTI